MDGHDKEDVAPIGQLLHGYSSAEENQPTSSFHIQVSKAWVGFGQTSESECEVGENKENISMAANRGNTQSEGQADESLQLLYEESQEVSGSPEDIFEAEEKDTITRSRASLTSQRSQEETVEGETPVLGDSPSGEIGENSGNKTSYLNILRQGLLRSDSSSPKQSSEQLDASVIVVSPSPKKEPSCIDISDSFQEDELKLELSQTQIVRESQLSEILAPNSLLNTDTDIDKMIADDDDVQNMSNMIDLDDTQPTPNYKEDSIDMGLFDPDFNVVMSPLKDLRRNAALPLKLSKSDSVISPLKVRREHGILALRNDSSRDTDSSAAGTTSKGLRPLEAASAKAQSPNCSSSSDSGNGGQKTTSDLRQDIDPGGRRNFDKVIPDSEKPKSSTPEIGEDRGTGDEGSKENGSCEDSQDADADVTKTAGPAHPIDPRSECQQKKRKAGVALSSEDESRKKMDIKSAKDSLDSGNSINSSQPMQPDTRDAPPEQNSDQASNGTTSRDGCSRRPSGETPDSTSRPMSRLSSERPYSRTEYDTPDISCSPIVARTDTEGGRQDNQDAKYRRTSTPGNRASKVISSPQKMLRRKITEPAPSVDSSEDEVLTRTKPRRKVGDEDYLTEEAAKTEEIGEFSFPHFKEPSPVNSQRYISINKNIYLGDKDNFNLAEKLINEFTSKLQEAGYSVVDQPPKLSKRISDASSLSRSSSGYLAGSSSGTSTTDSSKRSRLSMNPEVAVERHRDISKLPVSNLIHSTFHLPESYTQDSTIVQVGTQEIKDEEFPGKSEEEAKSLETIVEDVEPSPSRTKSAKKSGKRSRKGSDSNSDSSRKRWTKKRIVRKDSDDEDDEVLEMGDDQTVTTPIKPSDSVNSIVLGDQVVAQEIKDEEFHGKSEEEAKLLETIVEDIEPSPSRIKSAKKSGKRSRKGSESISDSGRKRWSKKRTVRKDSDDEEEAVVEKREDATTPPPPRVVPGDKVFGRWTDPAGVYFYAAEVIEILNQSEAKVQFLEDKIERVLKIESELINVKALHPYDEITVKHDVLEVYDVTAKLMSFPTRNAAGDVQYEVQITATDSEPQFNEDSRLVHFSEVSLTDNQASLIIRRMGFAPASNKVSADINFGNLIFGKRKPRTVMASPGATPATSTKARLGSPSDTPKKRRKRGGSHVEESAATLTESSAAENTPRGKKSLNSVLSTTEDERDNESLSKRYRRTAGSSGTPSKSKQLTSNIFEGMCFILTQSGDSKKMTDRDKTDTETDITESSKKFDKSEIRGIITACGGRVLQGFPSQEDLHETVNEERVTIADRMCLTMTYLLSLANRVPVLSYKYIHDCQSSGRKLKYRPAYMLPAGHSSLLMMDVEQEQDYRQDLQVNGCLLPSPPSTFTRLSNKSKEVEPASQKKILSGLHVLVLSKDKGFSDDWQSVLDSLGARVTKKTTSSARLSQIRVPDVVIIEKPVPTAMAQDLLKREDIPVVSTKWAIQCIINNARIAYDNFTCSLS